METQPQLHVACHVYKHLCDIKSPSLNEMEPLYHNCDITVIAAQVIDTYSNTLPLEF